MRSVKDGYLIVYVMILTFITMTIGLSVLSVAGTQYTHAVDDIYRQNAAYGAKACAVVVAENLTEDGSFSGFSDQVIFNDLNSSQGEVRCSAVVSDGSDGAKNADITSTMHRFTSDPHPISYEVRAVMESGGGAAATGTSYLDGGILAGHGGLYAMMLGTIATDQINILGKLYIPGASFSSVDIGTSADPIPSITVSNVACGDATDWPQSCTSQPVTGWYGSNFGNIDIHADTCAPGQTAYETIFQSPGLNADCSVATSTAPSFDKKTFVEGMTNTIDATDLLNTGPDGCINKEPIIPAFPAYGSNYYGTEVHIPANTRINGDLTTYYDGATAISDYSKCTLIFDGDSYVTGDVGSSVYIDIGDTTSEDVTMAINGKIRIGGQLSLTPNSKGSLMHIISFYSSNSSCSNSDVVPSVSDPSCLTNSQARQSSEINPSTAIPTDPALDFPDDFNNDYDFSGVTFYAYYGSVSTGCHNVEIAALGGQSISGGCYGVGIYSNLTTTASSPTFGELIPSTIPEYSVVDISRI